MLFRNFTYIQKYESYKSLRNIQINSRVVYVDERYNDHTVKQMQPKREEIVRLIRAWGGAAADALLDPMTLYHLQEGIEGLVGYRVFSNCAVVFGDPVCSPKDVDVLTDSFHLHCSKLNRPIIYLMASEAFAHLAIRRFCNVSIQYGEEIFIDPCNDPRQNQGTHACLVRRKERRAIREGVQVEEFFPKGPYERSQMEDMAHTWLQSRKGPQIHISNIYLFEDIQGKRWFGARHKGKLVGTIVLNSLESRHGWLINHLMTSSDAPNGTSELLVMSALDVLRQERCRYATFGAVPLENLGAISGMSKTSTWVTRSMYRGIHRLFHLAGLKMFWGKFNPYSVPSYLLLSRSKMGFKEIRALMKAVNASLI